MLEEAEHTLSAPQDWSKINLNHDEKDTFAQAAHIARFADNNGETNTPIKPEQLLVPRRSDDRNDDLWTVFNTLQKNLIKGGLRGVRRDEFGRPRCTKSRAANGIDQDIRPNKALWTIGEKIAALKK